MSEAADTQMYGNDATKTPIEKIETAALEFGTGAEVKLKEDFTGTFTAKNELGISYNFTGSIKSDLIGKPQA